MTQDEKAFVLRDLCARLPYGVKVQIPDKYGGHTSVIKNIDIDGYVVDDEGNLTEIEWARPYLFPLSSMTEEQKEEYYSLADDVTIKPGQGSYFGIKIHCIKLGISDNPHEGVWDDVDLDAIDWLNENHFDYRGLIPMGMAINATGLNIY